MNCKSLFLGAIAGVVLVGAGSTYISAQADSPATLKMPKVLAKHPSVTLLAQHFPAAGEKYYNASVEIQGNITDTWYEGITVALRFCGYKFGVLTSCKEHLYPVFKDSPAHAPGMGGGYMVCKITDGSTEIRVSGQNRSPIVAANPEASIELRDGNDDCGPRPGDYPSCN